MHALNMYFHVATAKRNFRITKCSLFCISYYIMWFLGLLCCNNTDLHTKCLLYNSIFNVYTVESIIIEVWAKNTLRCIHLGQTHIAMHSFIISQYVIDPGTLFHLSHHMQWFCGLF